MPRDEYQRIDLPVAISLDAAGLAVLRIGAGESGRRVAFGLESLRREEIAAADLAWLFRDLPPAAFVESTRPPEGPSQKLYRVVLDVRSPSLAELDWETLLQQAAGKVQDPAVSWPMTILRTCPVRPRSATLPLTLPLRLLQVQPRSGHPLPAWIRNLFGSSRPQEEVDRVVRVHATQEWAPPADWPTVEVLHLDSLPTLKDPALALTTADPERPGTLGWLARRTERWQTRLVVIHCETASEAQTARRLASALCDRGGPAVLVAIVPATEPSPTPFYQVFYDHLIHDFPLDHILAVSGGGGAAALFAGAGREDGLRVSNVAVGLLRLKPRLTAELERARRLSAYRGAPAAPAAETLDVLSKLEDDWKNYRFDLHERDGLLPLSVHLDHVRAIRRRRWGAPMLRDLGYAFEQAAARFLNSSLWREESGALAMIEQKSSWLTAGEVVHLAVSVGPKDVRIQTLDAEAIVEEVFKWSPERKGVWVDLALAGIDFDVLGDPVQELWLPREGASEPVYFAVRPREKGVAVLRFGLYYKNNLIQSFRLAAKVRAVDSTEVPGPEELAEALGIDASRVGDNGYLARLEYSRTSDLAAVEAQGGRALTIVANRLGDRDILTIKGPDICNTEVRADGDMPNIVTQVRRTLDEIAFTKIEGLAQPQYRFLRPPQELEALCKEAIAKLAAAGWRLFLNLAPTTELQDQITGLLERESQANPPRAGEPKTIHVAQVLRKKVIPWAFVYDRPYDEKARRLHGQPVEQGVCLAAVPQEGSELRARKCGEHERCLLNDERQAERRGRGLPLYDELTVACPLRFWGFRHLLEVPPQQVDDGDKAHDERPRIRPQGALQLAAGLNSALDLCEAHWQELAKVTTWIDPQYDRDEILDLLRTKEPDLIYFYCHARGGQVDPERTDPPYLEFQPRGGEAGQIRPQDLAWRNPWSHGPLIFLNACGTLGYSPDALSPFLKVLVDGRRASGVLGTEVPVAERLATDFSREFLTRFLSGASAGRALLEARLVLLAQNNPLGLVYTLFAPANLAIDKAGGALLERRP